MKPQKSSSKHTRTTNCKNYLLL
uniref:Uncharacterized protein n=1 Tax=Arundo donax TaxID=35708 RepID=A0A0A9EI78_ARUDO